MREIRRARETIYRAGSVLGDVEAITSGDPRKMAKRLVRKSAWRAWARLARAVLPR